MSKLPKNGMCGNLNEVCLSFFLNKNHIRLIYMLMHLSSLSSFGAQRQCCNLQSVYIRNLQFIASGLRLLVFERDSTHSLDSVVIILCNYILYSCHHFGVMRRHNVQISHLT